MDDITSYQFGRICNLVVFGTDFNGLDLSQMRIKFSVKRSDTMTPNTADIYVYNLDLNTALRIKSEFKKVTLQAGYEGNVGVIFQGNIKQVIIGRESATDTFVNIVAGDGSNAYNFAIVKKTIDAGANLQLQQKAALDAMAAHGVTAGSVAPLPPGKLPRGKVMYGPSKKYLRTISQTAGQSWSIQDGKVTTIPKTSYLPDEAVVLTSKTGMIGTPQQTNQGVNVKCLLNPNIKIGTRIQIDNKSIEKYKLNLNVVQTAANYPAPLTADGTYYVLVAEHSGDTRGVEWYTTLITLNIDVSGNPNNAIQADYG